MDDEPNARRALCTLLGEEGFEVEEAEDGEAALGKLASFAPAVVLTDVRMPRRDGLSLLQAAVAQGSDASFVMMTAYASVEAAVEAMKAGAENYLVKPLNIEATLVVLRRVLETRALRAEAAGLREQVRERFHLDNLVGDATALQAVLEVVRRAAGTRATVLVLGESGTGKELVAQALHQTSPRRDKPFVKVACAALPESLLESELFGHEKGAFTGALARREGRFEQAHGGTLFLDEIGDISPMTQVKLLRFLATQEFQRVGGNETIRVDVRLVSATHRDLAEEIKAGRFREDLYYRLNVVSVVLPPLRERKGDLPALLSHFISRFSERYGKKLHGLAPGTLQALMAHDWPGNVRELENAVERAVVLAQGPELTADDLPPALRGPRPQRTALIPGATLAEIEREAILQTLEMVGGSTTQAAQVLGISVRKIQYRLNEYGLPASTRR